MSCRPALKGKLSTVLYADAGAASRGRRIWRPRRRSSPLWASSAASRAASASIDCFMSRPAMTESAIRDAHSAGLINAPDAAEKARLLFTFYQGLLTEARIRNDLEVFRDAALGTFQLLGMSQERKAA